LPINVILLRQMLALVKKARVSAQGDLSMDWLRPFMTPRKYKKGDILFRKGDVAKEMLLTITGKFLVKEIGIELPPGRIMGELGFIDPKNRRTATIESVEDGEALTITYDRLLELYFQNPEFGYYLLRLTTERLMQNISRLEGGVAENKKKLEALLAAKSPA
jgi:CRP-like cAMP-binding protein